MSAAPTRSSSPLGSGQKPAQGQAPRGSASKQVKTCLDCPAEFTGPGKRCPACHGKAERAARRERDKRYRERKKAGLPARSPSRSAGALGTYEHAKQAIAAALTTDDALKIRDQADAMRVYAERAKDMQLQTDAIEISTRAKRRLGEIIKEQKDTVGLNTGAAGIGTSAVPVVDRTPTLKDAGISKNLSSVAQKLADIPEDKFEHRVDTWREDIDAGKTQPTVAGLTDQPKPPRKKNDAYYSLMSMIHEVCARWKPTLPGPVVEPCCGDGRFADALEAARHDVLRMDITSGQDFFKLEKAPGIKLCTNPPFKCFDPDTGIEIKHQRIRDFITHAFAIGFEEVCLIIPERMFACGDGLKFFEKHKPSLFAQMDWREDYLGRGGQANMMLAVAIWTSPCADACEYQVWGRDNQPEGDAS